ncbi:hypothetical protein KC19_5G205600 [Ceratodon purpureus]|uniref:Uncharacterized protein n=1 Tax=Ceratodon purpureus TaxID=3225 RepID=A0A8T0I6G4_CERPU|nr:hypothetical protein KC19_5G205600 [Ceratodon purpureus]
MPLRPSPAVSVPGRFVTGIGICRIFVSHVPPLLSPSFRLTTSWSSLPFPSLPICSSFATAHPHPHPNPPAPPPPPRVPRESSSSPLRQPTLLRLLSLSYLTLFFCSPDLPCSPMPKCPSRGHHCVVCLPTPLL